MIYLDNSASTQIREEVLSVISDELRNSFANPSSPYKPARQSRISIDNSRKIFAEVLNCSENEIIFTSGGTESDNAAIKGPAESLKYFGNHIITTAVEHHAVLHTCNALEKQGFEITYLPTDKYGVVSKESIFNAIKKDTILISIIYGNNEIGSLNPIKEIGQSLTKLKKTETKVPLFHTDAIQAAPFLNLDVEELGVDLMSLSAHKFNGPKGIGVLYMKNGTPFESQMTGGGQERQKRSGTENIAFIAGAATAIKLAHKEKKELSKNLTHYRTLIIDFINQNFPDTIINGHAQNCLPNIINLTFKNIRSDDLISALDLEDICISNGSACTTNSLEPSHVLKSIGVNANLAINTVRISLGRYNTKSEITKFLKTLKMILNRSSNLKYETSVEI